MELSLLLTLLLCSPALGARLNLRQETSLDLASTTSIATSTLSETSTTGATDTSTTGTGTTSGTSRTRTTSSLRSSTSLAKPVPLLPCRFADRDLFANITSACKAQITAVQSCPKPGAHIEGLLRAATSFSDCFEQQFYASYECTGWEARKDGAISLWKPFGHPTLTTPRFDPLPVPELEKGDCQYPDFLPILQEACKPLLTSVMNQFDECCDGRLTKYKNSQQVRDLVACVVQGSQQYVRCANTQRIEGDIRSCTIASAPKAAYLPPGIFVYDGSSVCKPFTFMMVYIAIAYFIDIVELFTLRWKNGKLWLVECPQQGFSLYRLLLHLVVHITNPFIMAAIVSGPVYEASAINELALFLMAPRASPIIALICAFIPGWRGFGAQHLVGDIIFAFITIFGWGVVPGTSIETWHGDAGAPSALVSAYNTGVTLAVMPNWLVIVFVILVVSCIVFFSSKGNRARRAGNIIGVALFVAIVLASIPFVALYEFIYGVKERREQRKEYELMQQQKALEVINGAINAISNDSLPVKPITQRQLSRVWRFVPKYFRTPGPDVEPPKPHLGWLKSIFRTFFPQDSTTSRKWGYIVLLLSSFCITVGNWMATVTLLNMAGEVFCPSNVWALVFAKLGMSFSRILLDFVHIP